MTLKRKRRLFLLSSIALYITSLTQHCYRGGDSLAVLLTGWMGLLYGGANLCWLANPLLWLAWILIRRNPQASLIYSGLALVVSLSFLCFNKIVDNEGGSPSEITGYATGYWLWMASSAVLFAGNLFLRLQKADPTSADA